MIQEWKELVRKLDATKGLYLVGGDWKLIADDEVTPVSSRLVEALTQVGVLERCFPTGVIRPEHTNLRACCPKRKLTFDGRLVRNQLRSVA